MNKFGILLVALFFSQTALWAQDAYLSNLAVNDFLTAGPEYDLKVNVRNATDNAFHSGLVRWQVDGGIPKTTSFNVGGSGLVKNSYLPLKLEGKLSLSPGEHEIKVWVEIPQDADKSNDAIVKNVIAFTSSAPRKMLVEKYTGTWCQYCPPADVAFEDMRDNKQIVLASFHSNDEYSFAEGETYMENYYPKGIFTPGGIINMGEFGAYEINSGSNSWKNETADRMGGISPVRVSSTVDIDEAKREVTVTVTAVFETDYEGDFYFNAYLIENNIIGKQTNAKNPYKHNNVVRAMLGGSDGVGGIIPAKPKTKTEYTYKKTVSIPSTWKMEDLAVVAYVFQKKDKTKLALNATKTFLYPTAIDNAVQAGNLTVYPNPANNTLYIDNETGLESYTIQLFDINGQLVLQKNITNATPSIDLSQLKPNVYMLRITNTDGTVSKVSKLIKL